MILESYKSIMYTATVRASAALVRVSLIYGAYLPTLLQVAINCCVPIVTGGNATTI
jgi:hypothetical protein